MLSTCQPRWYTHEAAHPCCLSAYKALITQGGNQTPFTVTDTMMKTARLLYASSLHKICKCGCASAVFFPFLCPCYPNQRYSTTHLLSILQGFRVKTLCKWALAMCATNVLLILWPFSLTKSCIFNVMSMVSFIPLQYIFSAFFPLHSFALTCGWAF